MGWGLEKKEWPHFARPHMGPNAEKRKRRSYNELTSDYLPLKHITAILSESEKIKPISKTLAISFNVWRV